MFSTRSFVVASLVVLAAACGSEAQPLASPDPPASAGSSSTSSSLGPTTSTPTTVAERPLPPQPASGAFLTYSFFGGDCDNCSFTAVFHMDGAVDLTTQRNDTFGGGIDPKPLLDLLRGATYDDLVLGPFTDECPLHVDGTGEELIIHSGDRSIDDLRLHSCTVDLDRSHRLFDLIDEGVDAVQAEFQNV